MSLAVSVNGSRVPSKRRGTELYEPNRSASSAGGVSAS
jgi:hypothetical protein